ncbi:MAG: hypothetical protein H0X28_11840 [Solirubrobacterales bacterium]|nr:hypothetical protein [Solirubrobacterales bacterium]
MAQISRPFQIALGVVALLGLVWVFALHRPSSSSTAAKASAEHEVAAATSAKAKATKAANSAPGVAGLTGAVAKAHGAVTTSQKNAKQLEEKSAQASASAPTTANSTPTTANSTPTTANSTPAPAHTAPQAKTIAPAHPTSPSPSHSKTPSLARQHLVEDELTQGRIVALLFWSPKGADDAAVRSAIEKLAKSDHGLSVHVVPAKEVASFGSITRGIQVYGTPTTLIVGAHGKTQTLNGLQDAYAIRQAINEARHSK